MEDFIGVMRTIRTTHGTFHRHYANNPNNTMEHFIHIMWALGLAGPKVHGLPNFGKKLFQLFYKEKVNVLQYYTFLREKWSNICFFVPQKKIFASFNPILWADGNHYKQMQYHSKPQIRTLLKTN